TLQDMRNDMNVDDRKNWLMMGLTFSLVRDFPKPLWWLLVLLLGSWAWRVLAMKVGVFGEADVNALGWVFLGFGMANLSWLVLFIAVFGVMTAIYLFTKLKVYKITRPTPFFAVILLAFTFSCWAAGLF